MLDAGTTKEGFVLTRIVVVGLIAASLTGCAYARFSHPQTNAIAKCGVVPIPPWFTTAEAMNQVFREISCKEELIRQGYVPIPNPDYPFM